MPCWLPGPRAESSSPWSSCPQKRLTQGPQYASGGVSKLGISGRLRDPLGTQLWAKLRRRGSALPSGFRIGPTRLAQHPPSPSTGAEDLGASILGSLREQRPHLGLDPWRESPQVDQMSSDRGGWFVQLSHTGGQDLLNVREECGRGSWPWGRCAGGRGWSPEGPAP